MNISIDLIKSTEAAAIAAFDFIGSGQKEEADRAATEAMKEALLESEDLKSVEIPNARGKQGEAASIATKHGYKPGAIRTCRNRLLKKVLERFEQEVKA